MTTELLPFYNPEIGLADGARAIDETYDFLEEQAHNPDAFPDRAPYSVGLMRDAAKTAGKLGEEGGEALIAVTSSEQTPADAAEEIADVTFMAIMLARATGHKASVESVFKELAKVDRSAPLRDSDVLTVETPYVEPTRKSRNDTAKEITKRAGRLVHRLSSRPEIGPVENAEEPIAQMIGAALVASAVYGKPVQAQDVLQVLINRNQKSRAPQSSK